MHKMQQYELCLRFWFTTNNHLKLHWKSCILYLNSLNLRMSTVIFNQLNQFSSPNLFAKNLSRNEREEKMLEKGKPNCANNIWGPMNQSGLLGVSSRFIKKQDPPCNCREDPDIPRLIGLMKRVKNLLPSLCLCRRLSIFLPLCLCQFICLHTCIRLCLCLCQPNTNSKQTLIPP